MDSIDEVSIGMLISDVTQDLGDPEFKNGLKKGWYKTKIRNCLDELAFKLLFDDSYTDRNYPDNNIMEMPEGLFDLQEMYLWNGDEFTPNGSVPVWWKKRLNNRPFGKSWTAERTINSPAFNPFNPNDFFVPLSWIAGMPIYIANVEDGLIQFDSDCSAYAKVRLIYTGSYGPIDEVKCIPRVFYKVIGDWVKYQYYSAMNARDPRYGWGALKQQAYSELYNNVSGSWWDARKRVRKMDGWQRNSQNVYSDRPDF